MNDLQVSGLRIGMISDVISDPYFIRLMKAHFGGNTKIYPVPHGEQNDDEYRK